MNDLFDTSTIVFEFRCFYDTLKFSCTQLYYQDSRFCYQVYFYINDRFRKEFRVNVESYSHLRLKCTKFIEFY